MTPLEKIIREDIKQKGPMRLDCYMDLAVGHYYATRDPFGVGGDFTTAPEISQMFGELLGLWAADAWMRMGRPSPFILLECGPGRGTLMVDALRAVKIVPGFLEAARIVLMETSPVLRERQKEVLGRSFSPPCPPSLCEGGNFPEVKYTPPLKRGGSGPIWIESLSDPAIQSSDYPVICIANEFLDALPIRQMQMVEEEWHERCVAFDDGRLVISHNPSPLPSPYGRGCLRAGFGCEKTGEGAIFEISPAREDFIRQLSGIIKKNGGAALLIDYGHEWQGFGDTLQAVKNHRYVPVLHEPGECDLTSHVDFAALKTIAEREGVNVPDIVEQGAFLESLGIRERAAKLGQAAELDRLTGAEGMGTLFKVMQLWA